MARRAIQQAGARSRVAAPSIPKHCPAHAVPSILLIIAPMAALDPDIQRPFLGIHAINVFVRDQDASLSFYIEKLGFNVAFDSRLPDGTRWVAVAPPDGSAVL